MFHPVPAGIATAAGYLGHKGYSITNCQTCNIRPNLGNHAPNLVTLHHRDAPQTQAVISTF
jgi:hypothetical protein